MYASNSDKLRKLIRENPESMPSQFLNDNSLAAYNYDNKTVEELKRALNRDADKDECHRWDLSHEEWRINIEMALIAKVATISGKII